MKKVFVLGVQPDPDGPVFGRVMDPNDFQKSQDYAHDHVNQVVRDLLVAGAATAKVAGFAATLAGGLSVNIATGAVVDASGISYESPSNPTGVALNAANPALPRIDLIYATLEIDTSALSEFRPFRRLRTQAELEAGTPEFPPAQFNQPTELHTRATINVKTGVANANPVAPAAGANEVPLWTVHVAAAQANLLNGDLTDVRVLMKSLHQAILDIVALQLQLAGLQESVHDIVAALIVEGPGLDVLYSDGANTLTISFEPALKALLDNATNLNNANTLIKRDGGGNFFAGLMNVGGAQSTLGTGTAGVQAGLQLKSPGSSLAGVLEIKPGTAATGGVKFATSADVPQNGALLHIFGTRGTDDHERFRISNTFGAMIFFGDVFIQPGTPAGQSAGNLTVTGNISKGSGTFQIDHPLDPDNKDLLHAFIESPRFMLIYDGAVALIAGQAVVNIDQASGMAPGTFAALTRTPRVFLQNNSSFTRVRPSAIVDGEFTIIAEDANSTDTVTWSVQCERKDDYIKSTSISDEEGHLTVETEKLDGDLNLLNPVMTIIEADEAAPNQEVTEVVWELVGKKGFPRHAYLTDPEGLPTRTRTIVTEVGEQD